MKKYIDLYINNNDIEKFYKIASIAKEFGYSCIGFENDESMKKIEICKSIGLDYILRTKEYSPKYREKILSFKIFENKKEAIEAVKRFKINILSVNITRIDEIDEELINFITQRKTRLEIFYSEIIKMNYGELEKILPKLKNIVMYSMKKGSPPIISSGAREEKEIRAPKEVIAFFKYLNLDNAEILIDIKNLKDFFIYETI